MSQKTHCDSCDKVIDIKIHYPTLRWLDPKGDHNLGETPCDFCSIQCIADYFTAKQQEEAHDE